MRSLTSIRGVSPKLGTPATAEAVILAKAADLGARLPAFRMIDAPGLFAGWSDRIALADMLRAAGKPHLDAVGEADRHLGYAPARQPAPLILPLSDWLGDIARLLGAPEFCEEVAKPANPALNLRASIRVPHKRPLPRP